MCRDLAHVKNWVVYPIKLPSTAIKEFFIKDVTDVIFTTSIIVLIAINCLTT